LAVSIVRSDLPISNVPVASCAPRENNSAGFRCALDILRRDTGDQIPRKILDQANGCRFLV